MHHDEEQTERPTTYKINARPEPLAFAVFTFDLGLPAYLLRSGCPRYMCFYLRVGKSFGVSSCALSAGLLVEQALLVKRYSLEGMHNSRSWADDRKVGVPPSNANAFGSEPPPRQRKSEHVPGHWTAESQPYDVAGGARQLLS